MSEQQTTIMVERVAMRIEKKFSNETIRMDHDFACEIARAAIEAMRECDLVYRNEEGQIVHELRGPPNVVWKIMIDAALVPLANPLATAPDRE